MLDIDFKKQQVIIETKLPSGTVHKILEQSGNTVVFRGHGYSQGIEELCVQYTEVLFTILRPVNKDIFRFEPISLFVYIGEINQSHYVI